MIFVNIPLYTFSLQLLSLTFENQPARKFIAKAEKMDDIRKIRQSLCIF